MSGSLHLPGASGDARSGNGSKSMRGGRPQGDALRRFGDAKKRMGDIFVDLEGYVAELVDSFVQLSADYDFVETSQVQEAQHNRNSITVIQTMLKRDHMKVVFFGRTSNGKSTVINAMLHSRVLPAGMGHTTSCFLQVEASPDDETFIMTENTKDRISIEKLNALAHASDHDNKAKGSASMGEDSLVRIFWPKNDSKLLQNDVVLLDSPGVDVSPEFDSWIDKHCLDADVFVLVCNAEATLTQAEKSFFNRVSSKLSKPNIFILNNRWDASAAEPEEMEQVREQHMTQFRRFLVQDLQVCTGEEAKDRIFFVSAREVLNSRAKKIQQSPSTMLAEGHLLRAQDFHNFEQQFETCISKSAIRTKFEGHIRRGREIMLSLQKIVESVHADALREKETRSLLHRSKLSELRQSQSSFLQFETKSRENADRLRAEVHVKVSADFHDEIRRLQSIIDSFDEKFVDDPACIAEYKNRLTDYVDDQVTKELEIRCTGGLLERIMAAQRDMLGGVAGLLPEDYAAKVATVLQYRPGFRFCIAVNCHTLVDDFVEDLEFRFSFGLTALVRRYVAYRSGRPVTTLSGQSARNLMLGSSSSMIPNRTTPTASPSRQSSVVKPSSSTSDMQSLLAATAADDAMLNSIVLTTASYVANGGVGLLLVTGLVYRTVGWRVIAIGAAGYMGLYAFERLRWNTHAKEQHLKEQFRSHLACRMRQLASAHTNQCETQVVREMEEILKSLKATVAGVHNNMKTDVSKLQSDMEQLDRITKELVVTKNKATFLSTNLDSFETDFLKPDSP